MMLYTMEKAKVDCVNKNFMSVESIADCGSNLEPKQLYTLLEFGLSVC